MDHDGATLKSPEGWRCALRLAISLRPRSGISAWSMSRLESGDSRSPVEVEGQNIKSQVYCFSVQVLSFADTEGRGLTRISYS